MFSELSANGKMEKIRGSQAFQKRPSFPNLTRRIYIYNEQRDMSLSIPFIKKIVSWLLDHLSLDTDEVTVSFVTNKKMCELHQQIFSDPSPTDCITLPIDPIPKKEMYHVLGEAFICPKSALFYSEKKGIDPKEELYRYIIHCFLHFAGYSDTTSKEKARMRRYENRVARKLSLALESQI